VEEEIFRKLRMSDCYIASHLQAVTNFNFFVLRALVGSAGWKLLGGRMVGGSNQTILNVKFFQLHLSSPGSINIIHLT
jgi:hypothetical protein